MHQQLLEVDGYDGKKVFVTAKKIVNFFVVHAGKKVGEKIMYQQLLDLLGKKVTMQIKNFLPQSRGE